MDEMNANQRAHGVAPGMPVGVQSPLPGASPMSGTPLSPMPGQAMLPMPGQGMPPGGMPGMGHGMPPNMPPQGGMQNINMMTPEQQQALLLQMQAQPEESSSSSDDLPPALPDMPKDTPPQSMLDTMVQMVKQPLIVTIVIFLMLMPQIHNLIRGVVPAMVTVNAFYMNGLKSLFGGISFYAINKLM